MGQRDDIPVADLVDEAILLRAELKDRRTLAQLLVLEGRVALARGDLERSVELWEETLALYREARGRSWHRHVPHEHRPLERWPKATTKGPSRCSEKVCVWRGSWITKPSSNTASSGWRAWQLPRGIRLVRRGCGGPRKA